MVNRRLWLAVTLVLGILAVGCFIEKEVEKIVEIEVKKKEKTPSAKGIVTINKIPEKYNDDYIYLSGYIHDDFFLLGFIDVRYPGQGVDEIKLATISNETAVVPVYLIDGDAESMSDYIKAYSGSGVFYGTIYIVPIELDVDNDGYFSRYERDQVSDDHYLDLHIVQNATFSNGNLTVVWPDRD